MSYMMIAGFLPMFSCVGGAANYIYSLEKNLDSLQIEFNKLLETREGVLNEIKVAEQEPRTRRTKLVKGWLKRVDKLESKVREQLKLRDREIDRLCLGGFCSKGLFSTYKYGTTVVKLKEEVIILRVERGEIHAVAEKVPEDAAVELALEQTVIGQESILDRAWRCIVDTENDRVIGLCGTGGVGKTTLLKHVNNRFRREEHQFDVVIWSVVSRKPNLEKIQADIGKRIGLSGESWQSKSLEDKASDITNILSRKKFVLLLDDVWHPVEFITLGVPLQCLNDGSKIVFTTRDQHVCGQMHATMLEVSCLGQEDALKLVEEEVGRAILESHPDIPNLAKTMSLECEGLPLALKTVAQAMSSIRNPEEWKSKIKTLINSASEFTGMKEKLFSRLKFSYDSLPRDKLRSCFLYCCLFPEDFEIPKAELVNYWISEGFVKSYDDGYVAIGDLVRAYLLQEEDDHVELHDMIRETGLWIACKIDKEKENSLVLPGIGLTKAKIKKWKGFKRISLMDNKIENLQKHPLCPNLLTLFLDRNPIRSISDGFFQHMQSLTVLSLRENQHLTHLPPGISSLVSLQHLDISSTNIESLCPEVKALVNLRHLDLENTHNMSKIPEQLLSCFSRLQVLKMLNCGSAHQPIAEEGNVLSTDGESLMNELLGLERLNVISLNLYTSQAVQKLLKFSKLCGITLSTGGVKSISVNVFNLAYMENLKELHIHDSNFEELKIDFPGEQVTRDLESGFFSNLYTVSVSSCSNVKDLTWLAFAPNLKQIRVVSCPLMEEIISAEKLNEVSEIMGELSLFPELETLSLHNVPGLKNIYRDPLPFPQLKEIRVNGCPNLKTLPLNSSSAKDRKLVIKGQKSWWADQEWENEATRAAFATSFKPFKH